MSSCPSVKIFEVTCISAQHEVNSKGHSTTSATCATASHSESRAVRFESSCRIPSVCNSYGLFSVLTGQLFEDKQDLSLTLQHIVTDCDMVDVNFLTFNIRLQNVSQILAFQMSVL